MMKFASAILTLAVVFSPRNAEAIPPIQESSLDNGLRVLLMEAHNVPMVSMKLIVPAGSRFDAQGRGGSAALLADMLSDHTALHDYEAWSRSLDKDAIMLAAGADRDSLSISVTVLKEVLEKGMQALSETVLSPGWNAERFAILRQDAVSAAIKAREDPGERAAEAMISTLFAGHVYDHRPGGNAESLKAVTLEDLKRLFVAQMHPDGSVLAVSGDVRMEEILTVLGRQLGGWKGRPEQGVFELAPPEAPKPGNIRVDMEAKQAHLMFASLGISRRSDDFFPFIVLNHILGGGGFSSRLMEEVREKRGLAYAAYSYAIPLAAKGPFVINLQTRADQAEVAADVVRQLMRRLHDGSVHKEWVDAAKTNLIGGFAQRMDSNRERIGLIGMIGFYRLPLDYLEAWTGKVSSVTLDQVKRMAARYLDPDAWLLVRAGPGRDAKAQ